jgi:hypothetical protein
MNVLNVTLAVIATLMSVFAVVISIVAIRRSSMESRLDRQQAAREAARDRILAGPIPHVAVVMEHATEGRRRLRIVVQNRGRLAVTMGGGGLAFDLPDGGKRLITIGYNEEVRVDPEGAPRGYIVTAPVLRNVLADADPSSKIRPFVILGTETGFGDFIPRGLIEMLAAEASPAPDQVFHVIDFYDDRVRDRELVPRADAAERKEDSHELTDGIYHAFLTIDELPE